MEAEGLSFKINPELISKVTGFPLKGDKILREKHSLLSS